MASNLPEPLHNNGEGTQKGLVGGVTGKGFLPGESGNPGGRPRGLQRRVRELVGEDGDKLAQFLFDVVTDTNEKTGERLEAARILLDRGWGKAPIAIDADGAPAKIVLLSAFAAALESADDEPS